MQHGKPAARIGPYDGNGLPQGVPITTLMQQQQSII
jgi:hypothetical protein